MQRCVFTSPGGWSLRGTDPDRNAIGTYGYRSLRSLRIDLQDVRIFDYVWKAKSGKQNYSNKKTAIARVSKIG